MKHLGNLIITISLIVGLLAAATSYFVSLPAPGTDTAGLALGGTAGSFDPRAHPEFGATVAELQSQIDAAQAEQAAAPLLDPPPPPVVPDEELVLAPVDAQPTGEQLLASRESMNSVGRSGDPLTPAMLEMLHAVSDPEAFPASRPVVAVRLDSFDIGRWRHSWVFAISMVGLVAGAFLVRSANKKAIAAQLAEGGDGESGDRLDPMSILTSAHAAVRELREGLSVIPDERGKMAEVVATLGRLQQEQMVDFVACRPKLIATFGLSGYASLMDHFARAERMVNRAWSASADHAFDEAMDCVAQAESLLAETEQRLSIM